MTAHRSSGFTLIEIMLILVIILVLAGIALPHYAETRRKAYDSKVENVVRHVATGEEAYFASRLRYTGSAAQLEAVVLDKVAIEISAGNSGDLRSSFQVRGSHPEAAHAFTWVSDPAPGEPHLRAN